MNRWILPAIVLTFSLGTTGRLTAADTTAAALAAESEAYCSSTINNDRPTPPSVVVQKVKEACALLEKEGPAAFPKFSGKNSPFIYEGTYICIHALHNLEMLVHPIKYKIVGTRLASLKDVKGKRLFVVMNDLVRERGESWVEYFWPKPGTNDYVRKISYVRRCRMANGVEVVVGSGMYKFSEEAVAELDLH